jgi:endogenous inhibitor of DNA gyrase (YacG/DUF329 family)
MDSPTGSDSTLQSGMVLARLGMQCLRHWRVQWLLKSPAQWATPQIDLRSRLNSETQPFCAWRCPRPRRTSERRFPSERGTERAAQRSESKTKLKQNSPCLSRSEKPPALPSLANPARAASESTISRKTPECGKLVKLFPYGTKVLSLIPQGFHPYTLKEFWPDL